ncbi:PREDICTED: ectonucleoside triphosphate diphosphohydrolase 2-like isoform X2 [Gavialis gangeticus]|uniref:ectonucleoside triphosphate diphosphohydrolase 2-like isoform X1 n=1 Tax=Gavialis gangeticus TaxID=94835 RepID=UPI00092FB194|nr:PREDICTED: ectonucleoside triphosphate diphosphohydrolase 2-like isoform X1 [Gavialis gangeticus]XP_019366011.1 PREDICTED: ectonucleoside triphosphate diphosphohydrolase 2-like isoform X2 [Gavialis gangeticus]
MSWRELLPPCLVIVAGLTGILLLCVSTKIVKIPPGSKYGIVLDAGPSHTTLFIYQWSAKKENNTGVVSEHSTCTVQGPGISNYSTYPEEAGNSLKACLKQAMEAIPEQQHSQTPVYLGATASMRLLNLTNPALSDGLLAAVTSMLKSYPFDFRGVKILSSQKEGVFLWAAVNYLLENFIKYAWTGHWIHSRKGTVGVMTLRRDSLQITFMLKGESQDPEKEVMLQLYGHTYKVNTHTFLCYGRDQVLKRLLLKVVQDQGYARNASNPCWPLSYSRDVLLHSVHADPCTASDSPLSVPAHKDTFHITGSSNSSACRKLVGNLFNSSSFCSFSDCSPNGAHKSSGTKFLVTSETLNFLKEMAPYTDLGQATDLLCGMSRKELNEKFKKRPNMLADYCTLSTFIYHLHAMGYQSDLDSSGQTAFQISDTSAGWALGYMLNLTNTIPEDELILLKGIENGVWSLLLVLLVLLLTGSFMRISYRVVVKDDGHLER